MGSSAFIRLQGLTKYYGPVKGLENVSLGVRQGEIFGFLGPNGAGKTTCIRMILGFLKPDRGEVEVFGRNLREDRWRFKERVGMLPGDVDWWHGLQGREVLDFFARFRDRPVLRDRILRLLHMDEGLLGRKVNTYSRGERRKIGLVAALEHDPDLLILDEPTGGLDPLMRRAFYDYCRELRERGKTVFLSSHNLYETQQICDRVGIVREGSLVAVETMEELGQKSLRKIEIAFQNPEDVQRFHLEGAIHAEISEGKITFQYQGPPSALVEALAGFPLDDITIMPPSLEDLFLHYLDPAKVGGSGGMGR